MSKQNQPLPVDSRVLQQMEMNARIQQTQKNVPPAEYIRLECDCGNNEFTPLIRLMQIPKSHKGNVTGVRIKVEYDMLQCTNPTCGMLYWRNDFVKVEPESALILKKQ